MIPKFDNIVVNRGLKPSKTYRIQGNRVVGTVDNVEAVRQAVIKILQTERYSTPIYSGNYGLGLAPLIGKDFGYVKSELKRRLIDALKSDTRVQSVDSVVITKVGLDSLHVELTVTTIQGSFSLGADL